MVSSSQYVRDKRICSNYQLPDPWHFGLRDVLHLGLANLSQQRLSISLKRLPEVIFTKFQLSKMFCHKCLCCQQAGSLPNSACPGHSTAFSPVPMKWRNVYVTTLWRVQVIPPPPVIIYKEYGGQSECACRAGHTLHTLSLRDWRHRKSLTRSSPLLLKNQYAPNRKQSVYDE